MAARIVPHRSQSELMHLLKSIGFYGIALTIVVLLGFVLTENLPSQRYQSLPDGSFAAKKANEAKDLPPFFFSLSPSWIPKEWQNYPNSPVKAALKELIWENGAGESWIKWDKKIQEIQRKKIDPAVVETLQGLRVEPNRVGLEIKIKALPLAMQDQLQALPMPQSQNKWLPRFEWNSENRFGVWLMGTSDRPGLIQGHLGWSNRFQQPVNVVINRHVGLTLGFSLSGLFLGMWIGVWYGFILAVSGKNPWLPVYLLSVPSFVLGSILLLLFANPNMLDWFFPGGISPPEGWSESLSIWEFAPNFFRYAGLPLVCFSYGSFASFSLIAHNQLQQFKSESWMQTALSKGLTAKRAMWVHGLPNALPMLQTRFFQSFPFILSGSVVLETLFSLPGLGGIGVQAVFEKDSSLLIGLLLVGATITIVGFVLSDVLNYFLDPRNRIDSET